MNELNLAWIQNEAEWENSTNSLTRLDKLIHESALLADLLILPEAFATGFSMNVANISQPMDGEVVNWMKKVADKFKLAVCGSVFIKEEEQVFNRFLFVFPSGEIVHYNKRHLFSMGGEDRSYASGNQQVLIEYKGWKIFPQICYDLRFPVWSRNTMNYDLLINVSNWPAVRNEVWETLLKARAIENQCFVAGVNRTGVDGLHIKYRGNSMAIDYKGKVLQKTGRNKLFAQQSIDKRELYAFRSKFDTLKDADTFSIH